MKPYCVLLAIGASAIALAQEPVHIKNPLATTSSQLRTLTRDVSRAVVQVEVTGYGAGGEDGTVGTVTRQQGLGSGVVIDSDGYIVTNAHVVAGAIDVKVLLASPSEDSEEDASPRRLDANVLGVDRDSDLALLKVNATDLPKLTFAPMTSLRQGDLALAIGNPMGLGNSVSLGVVSATARAISETSPFGYIQTDASINPGNSGGALVNADGQLIGINTFILSRSGGNEGLGFAIPANIVQDVAEQLRAHGHVDRGEIGITMQDITPSLSMALSLPRARGVILADVASDGPAAQAGMQIGDVLLSVNGVRVSSVSQFRSYAYSRKPGETVQVDFQRDGDTMHADVVMRPRHTEFDPLGVLASPATHLIPRLGVLGIEIDRDIAALLPPAARTVWCDHRHQGRRGAGASYRSASG
ncbi:MAG: trypsin-like peptidase domain-containing protein [Acidobacteriota bacterium]